MPIIICNYSLLAVFASNIPTAFLKHKKSSRDIKMPLIFVFVLLWHSEKVLPESVFMWFWCVYTVEQREHSYFGAGRTAGAFCNLTIKRQKHLESSFKSNISVIQVQALSLTSPFLPPTHITSIHTETQTARKHRGTCWVPLSCLWPLTCLCDK